MGEPGRRTVALYLELKNVLDTVKLLLVAIRDLIISNWSSREAMAGVLGRDRWTKTGHVMAAKALRGAMESSVLPHESPVLPTHRAENSSNVSSWCSERRRADVLKLGVATTARAAMGCGRAATRLARRKLEGPRAATRSREADIFFASNDEKLKGRSREAW